MARRSPQDVSLVALVRRKKIPGRTGEKETPRQCRGLKKGGARNVMQYADEQGIMRRQVL